MLSFLNIVQKVIISAFFLIYPFFFLNLTFEPSETAKLLLLAVIAAVLILISSLQFAVTKKVDLHLTSYLLPLLLLTAVFIVSVFLNSPNKILPLVLPGSLSTWILLFFLYLVLGKIKKPEKNQYFNFTLIGTSICALYVLAMQLSIFPVNVITPAGNLLSTAIFFTIILIYLVISILFSLSKSKRLIFYLFTFTIIALSQFFLVLNLITDQRPILLPNATAFYIFKEVSGDPKTLLTGVGPANFISAFTLYKPVSINETPLANITFTSSSSLFTNILTETGLISGMIYIVFIVITIYLFIRLIKSDDKSDFPTLFCLMILLILLFFFPGSLSLQILIICLMGSSTATISKKSVSVDKLGILIYLIPLTCITFTLLLLFFALKAYLAEYYYFKGVETLKNQDLTGSYNLQKQAITYNPHLDKYHLNISKLSLLLADGLLKNENPKDREKIPVLIGQAIEEGRIAVNLNKINVLNWANLTKIYSSLITFAPGAEVWAVEIGKQTIKLDPQNPNQYLALGQIYLKLNQKDEADKYFKQAKALRKDLVLPSQTGLPTISPDKE